MSAPVTAVCVTFNSKAIVERALASVCDDPLIERVIVVDNASGDGTADAVERRFGSGAPAERVRVLRNPDNSGFGAAANRGLRAVETPFALLLNPDAISDPGALAELLRCAEQNPTAALLGPRLCDSQGRAQKSFTANAFDREHGAAPPELQAGTACLPVEFIPAAYWLMRMETFEELGGFDESIFLYYEDDDYCLRATAAGREILHVPAAEVLHDVGTGSENSDQVGALRQFHLMRSRMLLERKHRGARASRALRTRTAFGALGKLALHLLTGRWTRARRSWARLQGALLDRPLGAARPG